MNVLILFVIALIILACVEYKERLANDDEKKLVKNIELGLCPNLGNYEEKSKVDELWQIRQERFHKIVVASHYKQSYLFEEFCHDYHPISKVDLLLLLKLMAEKKRPIAEIHQVLCDIFEVLREHKHILKNERDQIFCLYSQYQDGQEIDILIGLFVANEEHHLVRV